MQPDLFEASLKQEIEHRYREKYGDIQLHFDVIRPMDGQSADVQFTLSDTHGFITRYYGRATYQAGNFHMNVKAI